MKYCNEDWSLHAHYTTRTGIDNLPGVMHYTAGLSFTHESRQPQSCCCAALFHYTIVIFRRWADLFYFMMVGEGEQKSPKQQGFSVLSMGGGQSVLMPLLEPLKQGWGMLSPGVKSGPLGILNFSLLCIGGQARLSLYNPFVYSPPQLSFLPYSKSLLSFALSTGIISISL